MRINSEEDCQWNYINTLKEAVFVRYGTTQSVMTLSKIDQAGIWDSIVSCNFTEFEKLKSKTIMESEVKKYPIRIIESETLFSHLFTIDNLKTTLSEFFSSNYLLKNRKVLIQGVAPSLETPFSFLFETCLHPDYFLYIVIK
jgi:hypothetical protein